ncbi:hypothetical protein [Bacillus tuaregi]|uniref:hypothetical protein n=1 Tax=Bacillus tuaregi TaxID=1816695 RepID=UPI0008F93ED9|nr:hypothetical protein [Bacillus tuaregi]
MKKGRRNVPYPPYQYQAFSPPYPYPMMGYRGYDYAINNRSSKKTKDMTDEKSDKPTNRKSNEEYKTRKAAGPILFNPPVVNDIEIKTVKSQDKEEFLVEESSAHSREIPLQMEDSVNHKDEKEQRHDPHDVESSADYESVHKEIAMLESSSFEDLIEQEKGSSYQPHKFLSYFEESDFYNMGFKEDQAIVFEESSSQLDESSSKSFDSSRLEESSSVVEAIIKEESSILACESSSSIECETKQEVMPFVKMPILLSKANIEMDIFDSFHLQLPIKEITKVEWSVHSIECHVPLPSRSLFIKAILFADIEYLDEAGSSSLQTVKMQVPICSTENIEWLNLPDLPSSQQAEFMYHENQCQSIQFHQESSQQYAHPIQTELIHFNIIWHNEFISENGQLNVQGRISFFIHILQNQYIKLADH